MADNTNHSRQSSKVALKISLVAILTAVVVVFTMVPKIATPVVKGYISLCDVVICFAAFLLVPGSQPLPEVLAVRWLIYWEAMLNGHHFH